MSLTTACGKPKTNTNKDGPTKDKTANKKTDTTKTSTSSLNKKPASHDNFKPVKFDTSPKLDVTLSPGKPQQASEQIDKKVKPSTTPLDGATAQKLLGRLSDLNAEKGDIKDFAKREKSQPAPRPGNTVKTPFPPKIQEVAPDGNTTNKVAKALKILRFAPDGEVAIAPKISVTFNQPMVAVTSHEDTIKQGVPIEISPKVKGSWRWIGTKTVLFEPEGNRLPMATEYKVSIKNGTKSVTGQTLPKDFGFEFKTPAPKVKVSYPRYGQHLLDQVMFMSFDQQIDEQAILKYINVKSGILFGTQDVVMATEADIEKQTNVKNLVKNAKKGTWVAFKTATKLPYNSTVKVSLEKGAPSKEGPRTTSSPYKYQYQTFGPLRVLKHRCGWGDCRPNTGISFNMSNQIDPKSFKPSMVKISPAFPGANISASWRTLYVYGRKKGRTTYKMTLSKDIKDVHGQTLGKDQTFTFKVGSDYPSLRNPGGNFVTLDPSGEPAFSLFSTNYSKLRVKTYAVQPSDWPTFLTYQRDYYYDAQKRALPPGKLVSNKVINLNAEQDVLKETAIPLSKALGGDNLGHLVLEITPAGTLPGNTLKNKNREPKLRVWVQATQIGLDGFVDRGEMLGWATSLKSGEPLAGIDLSIMTDGNVVQTDKSGIVSIPLIAYNTLKHSKKSNMLVAKKGNDVAILPEHNAGYYYSVPNTTWYKRYEPEYLRWFVFDDRKMYKPSETVTLKGWFRMHEWKKGGGIQFRRNDAKVTYRVMGPRNNKLAEGEAPVTGLGGFSLQFKLPGTPNLGQARVELRTSGGSYNHFFKIQEFRRPEFAVKASAPKGPFLAGEHTTVEVEAKYYSGGALPMAETTWNVQTSEASFTPPNQHKYSFGTWTPWWISRTTNNAKTSQAFKGKTDVTGIHHLKLDFGLIDPPKPMSIRANTTVMDVNRQAWTSATNLLVHPSLHYVGLKSDKYFVEKNTPLKIQVIVADIEGNLVADRPVKVQAFRTNWKWNNGKYGEELVGEQTCDITTKTKASECVFKTAIGGTYKIAATTVDDFGRRNYTQITRWVSGGKTPKARKVTQEKVQLIPDKDDYQPGETAKILVQSPFTPAEGLLTLRRHGMVVQKRFTMDKSTITLDIPIKQSYLPNVYVQVNLVGSAIRLDSDGKENTKLPRRPAFAKGGLNLKVPPTERKLQVELTPERKALEPGAKNKVDVIVKNAAGKPVPNAEVALIVVDESVLALSSYQMADPMATFYVTRPADVRDYHMRSSIALADPKSVIKKAEGSNLLRKENRNKLGLSGVGRGGGGLGIRSARERAPSPSAVPAKTASKAMPSEDAEEEEKSSGEGGESLDDAFGVVDGDQIGGLQQGTGQTKIAVRKNFAALAAFAPAVKTDAQGKATLSFEMPDSLTRYRIMAVAVHEAKYYGTGESNVTARLPLMVRPSAPRFLNFGDQFNLPVVLQNQTDQPMTIQVAARATNVELTKAQAFSLQVPANDRVEVQFPATTAMAGIARFQIAASSGNWSDAAEFSLPVWTPATSEAFATYGVIDKGAKAQPVKTPGKVWPQFGGLHVTTSSTAVQALTDAFLYLYSYPYECAEQLSSRMISVAALRDVLEAFDAPGMPNRKKVDAAMDRDIKKLSARQNYNGGFGFWRKGQISWPFVSLHAIHALTRAKDKGYKVSPNVMSRGNRYLRRIEQHIPGYYGKWTRRLIAAYALYVRGLQGDKDPAKARALMARAGKLENLPFESLGWLLGVMSGDAASKTQLTAIRKFLANRVTETAGAAHFASNYTDGGHLVMHSDRRADGVILEALITDQPKSDLIPKIVRGLMAHRKKGRWGSTQENAMILLALDKYFNTYEKQTPNFVAKVWLGSVFAGQHAFKGRTTERHQIDVPMTYMSKTDGAQDLIIQKTGPGRLYYRIGMTYAPKSLKLEPADHGFVVERVYEAVEKDTDVSRLKDGTWKIRAGAKVRVKLTMVAPTRRYHVALVDPLPAGLEAMNPALAVTGDLPQDKAVKTGRSNNYNRWWWWSRPWFEHQNMRDERVEAFSSLLWGGVHNYTYYARATTPGRFIVPPTKAEEMYSPETFGRTGTDIVIVE